uniref:Large ribosomal subunit protein bL32c n=2 Tax=Angiopteris TaxID=3266 RepID=RK32_ANGEV|nr:ribosomal protein L32 [Angiopteris evecta]YP_009992478.1 ribosomal protein L32 [Angiopteris yunnanensis]YP_010576391.1 ribosomal protein L32 [Angiopteris fokiensis]A2T381.1 RecName: Full=Large ribosomal subunit protein bL32c; AltName: Full=50S ribosomal protein L32, chloroplastic [Angiopteris evecta]ABG79648.1 ribosomal protein L32 [Angiopteris evecta]QNN90663.1 ribosomal protein L32 [Angiopteris yunnanensis]UZN43932.1 ribosomal protein L32 [Angiopteris fokiensis]
MAVPKKRTSKSKKRIRKSVWREKTKKIASKAFSLAQSILTNRSKSFYYTTNEKISESTE